MVRLAVLGLVALVWALPVAALDQAKEQRGFNTWVQSTLWRAAKREGVTRGTFDAAMSDLKLHFKIPGLVYPGQRSSGNGQAEFRSPSRYFRQDNLSATARIGKRLAAKHATTLQQIERNTGVPGRIALSIWGRESGFGNVPIKHNAFQVLGTRAYFDGGDYLLGEMVAALQIAQKGHVPVGAMKSSWAGALGQPQMMPRSFNAYAADGNGDRRADIWGSEADTLASIANFLKVHDWVKGRDWGFEVTVPASVSCAMEGPDNAQRISDWAAMGIKRVGGKAFPASERRQSGSLLFPAGRYGPAFVVTPNFYVIKRYNHSDAYALYVGHSGDKIQYGVGPFTGKWKGVDKMQRRDVAAIQQALEKQGYDVGGADGLPGFKTRRSIGDWQAKNGMQPTCFPSVAVKAAIGR